MNPADLGNAVTKTPPSPRESVLGRLISLLTNLSTLEQSLEACRVVVEGAQPREATAQPVDAYPLSSLEEVLGISEQTLGRCDQGVAHIATALGVGLERGQGRNY